MRRIAGGPTLSPMVPTAAPVQLTGLAKWRLIFDLYQTAEDIMRQNLRRADPEASPEEIEQRLIDWLRKRPHGEHTGPLWRPSQRPWAVRRDEA